jgi:hypothetical protein
VRNPGTLCNDYTTLYWIPRVWVIPVSNLGPGKGEPEICHGFIQLLWFPYTSPLLMQVTIVRAQHCPVFLASGINSVVKLTANKADFGSRNEAHVRFLVL